MVVRLGKFVPSFIQLELNADSEEQIIKLRRK
jgi:hypothetical protein